MKVNRYKWFKNENRTKFRIYNSISWFMLIIAFCFAVVGSLFFEGLTAIEFIGVSAFFLAFFVWFEQLQLLYVFKDLNEKMEKGLVR